MNGRRRLGAGAVLVLGIFLVWLLAGGRLTGSSYVDPGGGGSRIDSTDVPPVRLAGTPGGPAAGAAPGGSGRAAADIVEAGDLDGPLALHVRVRGTSTAVAFASLVSEDRKQGWGSTNRAGELLVTPDKRRRLLECRAIICAEGFHPYPLPALPDEQEVYVVELTPDAPFLTLSGRITDPDGQPIAGAYVEIAEDFLARSDAEGAFVASLPSIAARSGNLEVSAWAPTFLVTDASVAEVGPAPWRGFVDVVLRPAEGWAPLTLCVRLESGEPAGGAAYVLRPAGRSWDDTPASSAMLRFVGEYNMPTRGTVPASGELVWPALPTNPARLRVQIPGAFAEAVVVASVEDPEVEVVLRRGRRARITFEVGQDVDVLAGQVTCLPVLAFADGDSFQLERVPVVDGSTQEIAGLPLSEFTLELRFEVGASVRVQVPTAVGPSEELIDVPCRLVGGRLIRGTVRLKEGGLLASGLISVETEQGGSYSARIRAGEFEMRHLFGYPRLVKITDLRDPSRSSRTTYLTTDAYDWDSDVWFLTME